MVSSLEVHIIYCITLVATILLRLRMDVAHPSAPKTFAKFESIAILACRAENSGISAPLLFDSTQLSVSDVSGLSPFLRNDKTHTSLYRSCVYIIQILIYSLCICLLSNHRSLNWLTWDVSIAKADELKVHINMYSAIRRKLL
jgi:hypothetical protein